jgi:hypothetical protein
MTYTVKACFVRPPGDEGLIILGAVWALCTVWYRYWSDINTYFAHRQIDLSLNRNAEMIR